MIIDIQEVRESGQPLWVDTRFTDRQLRVHNHISVLEAPASVQLEVEVAGERVRIRGGLSARLRLSCCRCLKTIPREIKQRFELEYWPDPKVEKEGEELALEYADLAIGFYRNNEIDLSQVASEQIVLEIPMKPVCKDKCKGLCDQCGADLNVRDCGCRRERIDPRLAALTELKKRFSH